MAPAAHLRLDPDPAPPERATGAWLGLSADPMRPGDPDRYPVAWGVLVHEAAHARHSAWQPPPGTPILVAEAAALLEEARVEARLLARRPGDRRWLRAAAHRLLLNDPAPHAATPWAAAEAAALLLARADTGVLDPDEARPLARAASALLGAGRLAALRGVWTRALEAADDDAGGMVALGRRWCELLEIDPERPQPGAAGAPGPAAGATVAPVGRAVAATLAAVAATDAAHAAAEAAAHQASQQRARARAADAAQRRQARERAALVFTPPGDRPDRAVWPRWTTRPPAPAERATARQLARALRRAAWRERAATTQPAASPPGRLSLRGVLSAAAQQAAGRRPVTAEPWRRTVRKHVPQPPLRVGICCDVSGSMSNALAELSAAVWVVTQAVAWAGGQAATVAFNHAVTPVTRPGEVPRRVRVLQAGGGTHKFLEAVDALDGALGLGSPGQAARLLVILSDGELPAAHRASGQARLRRLRAAGCQVLWVGAGGFDPLPGAEPVRLDDPGRVGEVIGAAAQRALRQA